MCIYNTLYLYIMLSIICKLSHTEDDVKHIIKYMKLTNRLDKTIFFCVDQEHALDMRKALNNLNADLTKVHVHYVARVVSDEQAIGRGHLDNFQDPEKEVPVILTTSQMLTTGVDAPTCRNVVLFKPINSKIGRASCRERVGIREVRVDTDAEIVDCTD